MITFLTFFLAGALFPAGYLLGHLHATLKARRTARLMFSAGRRSERWEALRP